MAPPLADQRRLSHILADDLQPRIDWAYALEQALSVLGGGYLTSGNGDPNGLVTKPEGYLFLDLTTPAVWQNQNGGTVWTQLGSGGGGSGLPDPWTADQITGEVTATVTDPTLTPLTIEALADQAAALLKLHLLGEPGLNSSSVGLLVESAADAVAQGLSAVEIRDDEGNPTLFFEVDGNLILQASPSANAPGGGPGLIVKNALGEALLRASQAGTIQLAPRDGNSLDITPDGTTVFSADSTGLFGYGEMTLQPFTGQTDPILALKDEDGNTIAYSTPNGPGVLTTQFGPDVTCFYASTDSVTGGARTVTADFYVANDAQTEWTDIAFIASCNADGSGKDLSFFARSSDVVGFVEFRLAEDVTIGARTRVQAVTGQTAPLALWESSAGVPVARVLVSGAIGTSGGVPADGDILAGELFLAFDPTNGASTAKFKGKSSDGTVVTATVPLT